MKVSKELLKEVFQVMREWAEDEDNSYTLEDYKNDKKVLMHCSKCINIDLNKGLVNVWLDSQNNWLNHAIEFESDCLKELLTQ